MKKEIFRNNGKKKIKSKDSKSNKVVETIVTNREKEQYPVIQKRIKRMKLTVLLVENTISGSKNYDILERIIQRVNASNYIYIITYNTIAIVNDYSKMSEFELKNTITRGQISNETCWYDALTLACKLIEDKYLKREEKFFEIVEIDSIEFIGIGSCIDTCSKVKREEAFAKFSKTLNETRAISKYYCYSEKNVIEAAAAGFHSIGFKPNR